MGNRWTKKQLRNPEFKAKHQAMHRAWAKKHRDLRRRYSQRWYQQRRESQIGRSKPLICDIYGEPGLIVFDHCHKLGHPRGWLCNRCNLVLGNIDDDCDLLRKMIAYLTHHAAYQSPQLLLPGF